MTVVVYRLKRIDFQVLLSIPTSRSYTDIARGSRVSLSSVPRVLERLGTFFLVRAFIDYRAMGYSMALFKTGFSEELYGRPVPFVVEKIPVLTGKSSAELYLLALCPAGKCEEVKDILRAEAETFDARRFSWRPDYAHGLSLTNGDLILPLSRIREAAESELLPRLEAPLKIELDPIDMWIAAELVRNPFARLSSEASKRGIRQQTVSFHHIHHVRPLHLFNTVTPKFHKLSLPGLLVEVRVAEGMAAQVAWALSLHPRVREAIATADDRVFLLSYLQSQETWDLLRFLRESDLVRDFSVKGLIADEVVEYTLPFGEAFREDPYNLEAMYEAVHTPGHARLEWALYEIKETGVAERASHQHIQ